MPLVEHLRELRRRLLLSVSAIGAGAVLGYAAFPIVLDALLRPYCAVLVALDPTGDCRLIALSPIDPFLVRLRGALLLGIVAAAPIVLYQVWRFVLPGLTGRERRYALPFVLGTQVMFALGLVFAATVIPQGLRVLLAIGGDSIVPMLAAGEYLSFVLAMSLAFGIVFELPLVLILLALLRVVTAGALRRARPYAVVTMFVVAAIVTPTVDALSLFLVALPMVVFYEVSIVVAWLIERGRR
ncbi:MAG: twin-arginine translocase subunit TatC [Actinomycetota bacterium]